MVDRMNIIRTLRLGKKGDFRIFSLWTEFKQNILIMILSRIPVKEIYEMLALSINDFDMG
jgi:hypothetical protein